LSVVITVSMASVCSNLGGKKRPNYEWHVRTHVDTSSYIREKKQLPAC
jgi:hypothetical protein